MVSMAVAGATKAGNVVMPSSLPLGNKSPCSRSVRISNVFSVTSSTLSSVRVSNVFSSTSSKVSSKIVRGTPTAVNPTELSRYCKAKATFGRFVTSIRAAAIAVGDKLPEATLCYIDSQKETNGISKVTISELTAGKKVILFAVPGAYMPTCSGEHLPGFVEKAEEFKAKGIDTIACISVNDIFVMKAWGDKLDVNGRVLLLSDEDGEYTKAIDSALDFSDKPGGLGLRSRRYAMYVEDGVVKLFNLEVGGSLTFSSAEEILKSL